jgi:hypothetical protein
VKTKERYRVNRAAFEFVQQGTFQYNRRLNFFVQFVRIPNAYVHYKSAAPNIVPYLPNDVMYPFFIATGAVQLCVLVVLMLMQL